MEAAAALVIPCLLAVVPLVGTVVELFKPSWLKVGTVKVKL